MYGYLEMIFLASFHDRVADIICLIYYFFFNNMDVKGLRNTIFEENVARSEKLNYVKAVRISITFQDQDIHLLGTFPPSPFIPSHILS